MLFQRVNTAGVPLNPQEIRNALYQKKATDLLRDMVALPSFQKVTNGKIPSKRMTDCDFANRFLAFYLQKDKYDGNLDVFMGDALENTNKMSQEEIKKILQTFDRSMDMCFKLLGDTAFKRPNLQKAGSFLKFNKAIFEALSVSIAKLSTTEQELLLLSKSQFQKAVHSLFKEEKFIKSITSGTAKVPQVEYRHSQIIQLINRFIKHDN